MFYLHQADRVATELAGVPSRSEEEFRKHWNTITSGDEVVREAILFGEEVVGFAVSFDRDEERQVGYWIGRDYWGRRIASAALPLFLEFESRRSLRAHVAQHNPASIRVLEKAGFSRVDARVANVRGVSAAEYVYELV
jgi:RimJ/RimL family protein N-acetyltransferase